MQHCGTLLLGLLSFSLPSTSHYKTLVEHIQPWAGIKSSTFKTKYCKAVCTFYLWWQYYCLLCLFLLHNLLFYSHYLVCKWNKIRIDGQVKSVVLFQHVSYNVSNVAISAFPSKVLLYALLELIGNAYGHFNIYSQ